MSDLISKTKLMEDIRNTITENSSTLDWLNLISRQPTAYNVDKVVEQLQHPTNYTIVCGKHHTTVERAVDIVKAGGVE